MQLGHSFFALVMIVLSAVNASNMIKYYTATDIQAQRAADILLKYLNVHLGLAKFHYNLPQVNKNKEFEIVTCPSLSFKVLQEEDYVENDDIIVARLVIQIHKKQTGENFNFEIFTTCQNFGKYRSYFMEHGQHREPSMAIPEFAFTLFTCSVENA